jgi:RimJ/RimL family protein N-acetyltransferase
VLSDGVPALVRPVTRGETAVVQEVVDGMSERSRRQRFLGAKRRLSQRDLELLVEIDHENNKAVVALDPVTERAIGEARLVRDQQNRTVGEVAFAVADAWQSRRLSTRLAELLARQARELGIRRLRGNMFADNSR